MTTDERKDETMAATAPRPRLLDLFCGAGGAAMGYARAGFAVTGVDLREQRRYPFPFALADALELSWMLAGFDAVHASPPCQRFSALNNGTWGNADDHPDLIGPVREMLDAWGGPYVIENVPGAPLRKDLTLCGSMFGLEIETGYLKRHRIFESNRDLGTAPPCNHGEQAIGVYGHGRGGGPMRGRTANAEQARRLMGMPWAHRDGLSQAIPPAYTEHIGRRLIEQL